MSDPYSLTFFTYVKEIVPHRIVVKLNEFMHVNHLAESW